MINPHSNSNQIDSIEASYGKANFKARGLPENCFYFLFGGVFLLLLIYLLK